MCLLSKSIVCFVVIVVSGGFCIANRADADIFDLSADFSNVNNPNGAWSFTQSASLLTHFPQPTDSNSLNPAAGNGYWGVGNNFSSFTPEVIKVTQSGSSTSPYNDDDFLVDDVISHSPNPGTADLFINWTSPGDGTITFTGSAWYAHSFINRSTDFFIELNGGTPLASGSLTLGENRSNWETFSSSGPLSVNAGDVLAIRLRASAGQSSGSLIGLQHTVNFTAVPEPAGGLTGFAVLFFLRRRKRRAP